MGRLDSKAQNMLKPGPRTFQLFSLNLASHFKPHNLFLMQLQILGPGLWFPPAVGSMVGLQFSQCLRFNPKFLHRILPRTHLSESPQCGQIPMGHSQVAALHIGAQGPSYVAVTVVRMSMFSKKGKKLRVWGLSITGEQKTQTVSVKNSSSFINQCWKY